MRRFLDGQPVDFPVSLIDLGQCSGFQRRVLLAEHRIPRGRVSTYGRIAAGLGCAGRRQGSGHSPGPKPLPHHHPLPPHRQVRRGPGRIRAAGPHMKRALLELEGVEFTSTGKVAAGFFC